MRAKTIQSKCESLLMSIYQKSKQWKQPERIRLEYVRYLNERLHEEMNKQKKMENFYDKIERIQYDHYQKLSTSSSMEVKRFSRSLVFQLILLKLLNSSIWIIQSQINTIFHQFPFHIH